MLTDRQIKALKPREGPYRMSEDTNMRGSGRLVIEVKPNGAKYFFFQYFRKQDGKSKRTLVSIGRFKDSAKMIGYSLSEARDETLEYGNILKQGLDVKTFIDEKKLEAKEPYLPYRSCACSCFFQDYRKGNRHLQACRNCGWRNRKLRC